MDGNGKKNFWKQAWERRKLPKEVSADKKEKRPKDHSAILKKNTLLRFGRTALWIMLVFFFLKGLAVTFKPDTLSEAQALIDEFNLQLEERKEVNNQVAAFAQNFVYEYLTYDAGQEKDYKERLQRYLVNPGNLSDLEIYRGSAQALYVQAYKQEQCGEHSWDVYVLAEAEYKVYQDKEEQTMRSQTCVRVPVFIQNGSMAVDGLPMFVNDSVLLKEYEPQEYIGTAADAQTTQEASTAAVNFLTAYYGQDASVIEYYLSQSADRSKFMGLEGRYTFEQLHHFKCYQEPGQEEMVCIADFKIADEVNQAKLQQKLRIDMMKGSDGKYYVNAMMPRTGN